MHVGCSQGRGRVHDSGRGTRSQPLMRPAMVVIFAVAVVVNMALVVSTVPVMAMEATKGVFFFIVLFCVQPYSRRCARPTLRLRSSSGNCGPMVCGCGTDKVESQLFLGRDYLRQAGLLLRSNQLLHTGRPFSCGATTCLKKTDLCYCIIHYILRSNFISILYSCILMQHRKYS